MYKIIATVAISIIFIISFINFDSYYDEKEIRLGMSGPFSGTLHAIGNELMLGISAYFMHINNQGGVYDRVFRVITKDDKYEPKITAENALELIKKERVFAFIGFVGTPTGKVALDIAKEYNIPFIGAFSGADFLRETPRNPLVLNGRASYEEEIKKLVSHFVVDKNMSRIAVFYQNDSFGRSGLMGVKQVLSEKNLSLNAEGSYKRNTLSVGNALYEISQSRPEVVIMIGSTYPTAEFIKRARNDKNLKNVKFGIISFAGSKLLLNVLDKELGNIIFSQVMPSPWAGVSKEIEMYRMLMDRYHPEKEYSYVSLEGFFIAKMTAELFRRAGEDFTKQDIIDEIKKLYFEIENNLDMDESKRICKCFNNVYLTYYEDGVFWEIDEKY